MERQPWERMEDEPGMWWERFDKYYRPLGAGRKLQDAYYSYYRETHGKNPARQGYTESWKEKHDEWNWSGRAEAYDRYIHEEIIRQEKEERVKMSKRHIEDAQAIQTLAMNTILEQGITDVPTALRAFRQAVTVERQARGIPDHLVEITDMSDEELEDALARELARAHLQGVQRETERHDSISEREDTSGIEESRAGERGDTPDGEEVSSPDPIPEESS